MLEKFLDWRPTGKSADLIDLINSILDDYASQGYRITLRQLYYQLVAGDHIPNTQHEYKKLGYLVNRGRMAALIDWDLIEDRSRSSQSNTHWDSPKQIIRAAAEGYQENRWNNQDCYIEVWCEKDAVSNVIQPVCSSWDVRFMANRGYLSQSAMYEGAMRFRDAEDQGKAVSLLYLGDHDPSGIDMHLDIQHRMEVFLSDSLITIDRIALTRDQIQQYKLPTNPAKQTDSRFTKYQRLHNTPFSWELDALQPLVLRTIVETEILRYIDEDRWAEAEDLESISKQKLKNIADTI